MKTVLNRAERLADSAGRFVRVVEKMAGKYNPREAHIALDPAILQGTGSEDARPTADHLMRRELSIMLRRALLLWLAILWFRVRAAASHIVRAAASLR